MYGVAMSWPVIYLNVSYLIWTIIYTTGLKCDTKAASEKWKWKNEKAAYKICYNFCSNCQWHSAVSADLGVLLLQLCLNCPSISLVIFCLREFTLLTFTLGFDSSVCWGALSQSMIVPSYENITRVCVFFNYDTEDREECACPFKIQKSDRGNITKWRTFI